MRKLLLVGILCLAAGWFIRAQTATATIKLTWTDTVNPTGTGYNVRRGNSPTACTSASVPTDTCTLLNLTPLIVLTFTDVPAVGSVYYYNVKAVNQFGEGPMSAILAVTLLPPTGAVNATCTFQITGGTVGPTTCK